MRSMQPPHTQEPAAGLNLSNRLLEDAVVVVVAGAGWVGAVTGDGDVLLLETGDLAKEENAGDGMLESSELVLMGTAGPSCGLNGDVVTGGAFGKLIWNSCGDS